MRINTVTDDLSRLVSVQLDDIDLDDKNSVFYVEFLNNIFSTKKSPKRERQPQTFKIQH